MAGDQPVAFITTRATQQTRVQRAIRVQATALRIFGIIVLARLSGADAADHLPPGPGPGPGRPHARGPSGCRPAQLIALPTLWAAIVAVPAAILAGGIAALLSPFSVVGLARKANPDPGFSLDVPVIAIGVACVLVGHPAADPLAGDPPGPSVRGPPRPRSARAGRPGCRSGSRAAGRAPRRRPSASTSVSRRAGAPARSRCRARSSASRSPSDCSSRPSGFGVSLQRVLDTPALYGWTWDIKTGAPALPNIGHLVVPALRADDDIRSAVGRDRRPGRPRGSAGRRAGRHPREGRPGSRRDRRARAREAPASCSSAPRRCRTSTRTSATP